MGGIEKQAKTVPKQYSHGGWALGGGIIPPHLNLN